jgi:hypothetical protein
MDMYMCQIVHVFFWPLDGFLRCDHVLSAPLLISGFQGLLCRLKVYASYTQQREKSPYLTLTIQDDNSIHTNITKIKYLLYYFHQNSTTLIGYGQFQYNRWFMVSFVSPYQPNKVTNVIFQTPHSLNNKEKYDKTHRNFGFPNGPDKRSHTYCHHMPILYLKIIINNYREYERASW